MTETVVTEVRPKPWNVEYRSRIFAIHHVFDLPSVLKLQNRTISHISTYNAEGNSIQGEMFPNS